MKKGKVFSVLVSLTMIVSLMALPIKVNAAEDVASIGETKYATLVEAFTSAKNGETIEVLKDTLTDKITLTGDKNVILDLNGHEVKSDKDYIMIALRDSSVLSVIDSSSDKAGSVVGSCPIWLVNNATFTLKSGNIKGLDFGVSGNGSANLQGNKGTTINIEGGSVTQVNPNDFETSAVYHPQKGIINISGGSVKGSVGIQLCSGALTTVNINGGTVTGTSNDIRENKTGDGPIGDGAAISAINRNYPGGAPYVTITGGTFVSEKSKSILAYNFNGSTNPKVTAWTSAAEHIKIEGGTFNTTPTEYVTGGNKVYQVGTTFKVAPMTTDIKLSSSTLELEVGKTKQLTTTLTPSQTLDKVVYTSTDTTIATISDEGLVTAKKAGTSTITATAGGKTATCTVTVKDVPVIGPSEPVKPTVPTTPTDKVEVGIKDDASKEVIANTVDNLLKDILGGKEISSSVMSADTVKAVKEALANGKSVVPVVENTLVKESEVSKDVVAKVHDLISKLEKTNGTNATVAQYLDLGVTLTVNNKELGSVNQLDKPVTFTVNLTDALKKDGRVFYVVRIHDGKAERIDTIKNGDGTLTFKTDKFSTYALVYEDKVGTSDTVKTSDSSEVVLFASVGALALVAGALVLLYRKRDTMLNK